MMIPKLLGIVIVRIAFVVMLGLRGCPCSQKRQTSNICFFNAVHAIQPKGHSKLLKYDVQCVGWLNFKSVRLKLGANPGTHAPFQSTALKYNLVWCPGRVGFAWAEARKMARPRQRANPRPLGWHFSCFFAWWFGSQHYVKAVRQCYALPHCSASCR